jgi:type II secretory pathway pseudopilin PulG
MVEIAICLAIIGIALVSIIGVLPIGMNTQRDNREETIINQDATILMEAIRSGARGMDDLTNYVYAITNFYAHYKPDGTFDYYGTPPDGFSTSPPNLLTNGANIVGALSRPEFIDGNGFPTNNVYGGGFSNHVVAYVRSMSGPAVEKPPQDNQLLQQDSFGYRVLCVNAPIVTDTNGILQGDTITNAYYKQLAANLHELRLTFLWPQLPNGSVGPGRQTFRTLVAGQITRDLIFTNLYFYQSQSFLNVTNAP